MIARRMGDELEQCAESIAQIERHAEQLSKYGKDLDKKGANISQVLRKAEEEVDAGRYLTEETGKYLKERLKDNELTKQTRMRLEKLSRLFATAGQYPFIWIQQNRAELEIHSAFSAHSGVPLRACGMCWLRLRLKMKMSDDRRGLFVCRE